MTFRFYIHPPGLKPLVEQCIAIQLWLHPVDLCPKVQFAAYRRRTVWAAAQTGRQAANSSLSWLANKEAGLLARTGAALISGLVANLGVGRHLGLYKECHTTYFLVLSTFTPTITYRG